jgi:Chondroitin N-acetylgalactosaminyltransferase
MENINNFSRQRGRVIEFRELLYGYSRTNAIFGQDLILDLLLVYKKYRGKKMTVPVRRHLYIQRSFTEIRIREMVTDSLPTVNTYGDSISSSKINNNHFLSRHQTMDVQPLKQKNVNGGKLAKMKKFKFSYYHSHFFGEGEEIFDCIKFTNKKSANINLPGNHHKSYTRKINLIGYFQ